MNLDSVLAEPQRGIVDHDWLVKGIEDGAEVGSKNPNNIKPELEMEWGGGSADIFVDAPAGVVNRNLPAESQVSVGDPIILFARDLMNQGRTAAEVKRRVAVKYGKLPKSIQASVDKQLSLDGLVGRVAVDARGYKNCKVAMASAAKSPYKRFVSMVIGCRCGDPLHTPTSRFAAVEIQDVACGMDACLADESLYQQGTDCRCPSTALELVGSRGDLDDKWTDDTLMNMEGAVGLPIKVAKEIKKAKCRNAAKVMMAFRWLDRKAQVKKAVDASKDVERIAIAPMNVELEQMVDKSQVPMSVGVSRPDITVNDPKVVRKTLDIQTVEPTHVAPLPIDAEEVVPSQIDVNPYGEMNGVEFGTADSFQDIDMTPELTGVWNGVDEVCVDEEAERDGELDVQRGGGMEW